MAKKEEESIKGYAIAEYLKNGKFKCFWKVKVNYPDFQIKGVTGNGELYNNKQVCKDHIEQLNTMYPSKNPLKCVEVKMVVIENETQH